MFNTLKLCPHHVTVAQMTVQCVHSLAARGILCEPVWRSDKAHIQLSGLLHCVMKKVWLCVVFLVFFFQVLHTLQSPKVLFYSQLTAHFTVFHRLFFVGCCSGFPLFLLWQLCSASLGIRSYPTWYIFSRGVANFFCWSNFLNIPAPECKLRAPQTNHFSTQHIIKWSVMVIDCGFKAALSSSQPEWSLVVT